MKNPGAFCLSLLMVIGESAVLLGQQRRQPTFPQQAVRRALPQAQQGGTVANPTSFEWVIQGGLVKALQRGSFANRVSSGQGTMNGPQNLKNSAAIMNAARAIRQGTFGDGGVAPVGAERTMSEQGAGGAQRTLGGTGTSSIAKENSLAPGVKYGTSTTARSFTQACPPGTTGINNVDHLGLHYFIFSPYTSTNPYRIGGCGFGDRPGQVWLTGVRTGHPMAVAAGGNMSQKFGYAGQHPGWIKLDVYQNHWNNRNIDVTVDPNTSGFVRSDKVTLLIITADGHQYTGTGCIFSPVLVEQRLPSIPQNLLITLIGASSTTTISQYAGVDSLARVTDTAGHRVTSYIFSPSNGAPILPGHTLAVVRQDNMGLFRGNTDAYSFLGKLWITRVDLFASPLMTRACTSLPGRFAINGNWRFAWTGSPVNFAISWQEQSCTAGTSMNSSSVYALDLYVLTARGVDTWTTWQNQY